MGSASLTPTLHIGEPADATWLEKLVPVTSAAGATALIRVGWSALLPTGAWDMAREVLAELGTEPEEITRLIEQAGGPRGDS